MAPCIDNTAAKATRIQSNPKLTLRLKILEMKPKQTGPKRKPTKPNPETNEILAEAEASGFLPEILNNSGIITDNPKPTTPKPTIDVTN